MKHPMTFFKVVCSVLMLALCFVGTASATTLENSNGEHPNEITASLVGSTTFTAGGIVDTCTQGSFNGSPSTGGATTTVTAAINAGNMTWGGCTQTTKTIAGGALEIHYIGDSNGTVTGTTFEVTILMGGSVSCVYGVSKTDTMTHFGTLTGSDTIPILHIQTKLPKITGSFLCSGEVTFEATYHVTNQGGLTVT